MTFTKLVSRWVLFSAIFTAFLSAFSTLYNPPNKFIESSTSPVLLLTAHPDDEVMFFSPTIMALKAHSVPIFVMCLSIGDADGLGEVRRREFASSLDIFGIGEKNRQIVDHPKLQDNFTQAWDPSIIAALINPMVSHHKIGTILTFDSYGVSGHPNHASLPAGVMYLLTMKKKVKVKPKLFTLVSRNRVVKFTGPLTLSALPFQQLLGWPTDLTTVIVARSYITALTAMFKYQSQLVWFRYLYLIFSRYMYINEWEEWVLP